MYYYYNSIFFYEPINTLSIIYFVLLAIYSVIVYDVLTNTATTRNNNLFPFRLVGHRNRNGICTGAKIEDRRWLPTGLNDLKDGVFCL